MKLEPDSDITSEDVVRSHPTDTTAQIPEVVLSDIEEFEEMDIVIPSTDESAHMLPFPQVSVEGIDVSILFRLKISLKIAWKSPIQVKKASLSTSIEVE